MRGAATRDVSSSPADRAAAAVVMGQPAFGGLPGALPEQQVAIRAAASRARLDAMVAGRLPSREPDVADGPPPTVERRDRRRRRLTRRGERRAPSAAIAGS